jgi:HEAT repeats
MEQPEKDLYQSLENWKQGRVSLDELRALSRELGNQRYKPGIPALIQLLDHEDGIVRYNAAMALGFELHHKPATNKLLAMLREDVDEDVRDVAAGALRTLWQNSKDPHVIAALAKSALTDPDEDIRKSAYKALLIVNGVPNEEHLQLLTGGRLPVDPIRVEGILAGVSG